MSTRAARVKRKQATLKTFKTISSGHGKRIGGAGDSDGDNDFIPTKKAAAANLRAKPHAPPGNASRARPNAKTESNDDDKISFSNERPPSPKGGTLAPAKKLPPKAESGSYVDMADDAQLRPPLKVKKSTLAMKDPDSDSGNYLVRAAPGKDRGKVDQSQTSKRKS